ncbi:MAG: glycoside hydrolase family 2 [Rhodobacterales bacterium]|nr:glycoside hydrolase family 2 [Rhodobacterales bacterium]
MLPESPTRYRQSLDGEWHFVHASDGALRVATVPQPWQAQFADLRQVSGRASYSRRFARPADPGEVVLHFGAVSYHATVRVNGRVLGEHEGGYLPFAVTVPAAVLADDNLLEVACILPDGDAAATPDFPFAEIPHGKQSWYGPIGGIWQAVTLECRPAAHLLHCAIDAALGNGRVTAQLTLSAGAVEAGAQLSVIDPAGQVVAMQTCDIVSATQSVTLHVADVLAWSPDAPHLYRLRVDLRRGDSLDTTFHSFGFRSFETRGGQMWLNGAPFYMRAALDQDYYPEGICTPPSTAFLEDQLHKARALGLNMMRCHIKVPDPRYYEVADRLGMLIWTEIPNVGTFTDAAARRMRETMEGILARDGNHPSIVIWTVINEDWGTRLREDPAHRAWVAGMYDWLKQRDPSRLVVDNSPCHGNFHVKSDLDDFHYYRSVPERRAEWDALTAEFAAGADWTYSPFGDAVRRGDEPRIVSEFGVWGLPQPTQVRIDGAEPWWMETGSTWGDGAAYPHGIEARFASHRLDTVFGSFDAFIDAAQWYQFANLKYEIEAMRRHPQITGYVITEFTDVHWESNGLLDMNRNPRVFHDDFASINADLVIVPLVERYSATAGGAFSFDLVVATGGAGLAGGGAGGVLRWEAESGQSGRAEVAATGPMDVSAPVTVSLDLPAAEAARMLRIAFVLEVAGREIARNRIDIAVYPARVTAGLPALHVPDPALAAQVGALGYPVGAGGVVTVVAALDAADIARMQAGARYLVLADGSAKTQGNLRLDAGPREQPFIPIVDDTPGLPLGAETQLPNIGLVARHGTMWRGDWIAGFSWLRRAGAFAAIPGGPLVDLSFDRVIPHHVLTGFRAWDYAGQVHAATNVGWLHKPAVLIGERQVGRGALLATTFRLFTDPPGQDPVAAALFDAHVQAAMGLRCDTARLDGER